MKKVIAFSLAFAPVLAFAQRVQSQDLTGVIGFVRSIMNTATTLIMSAAVLWFLWGVFEFVRASGDPEKRDEGRKKMVAGIIGLAVMGSVWGLVRMVTTTTGTAGQNALQAPSLIQ